jgi:cytochrome c553
LRRLAGLAATLLHAALPAAGQPQPGIAQRAEACFACHGKGGQSAIENTPSLAGQPSFFVVAQLFLFRDGRRGAAPQAMYDAAKGLTNDDLRAFGDYLSRLPPAPPPAGGRDATRFERGRALAQGHNCGVCHNPDYSGREQMPRLANQREDYLLKALRDYKQGARIGYGSATMPEAVAGLRDEDLAALAHYLAHLPRGGR